MGRGEKGAPLHAGETYTKLNNNNYVSIVVSACLYLRNALVGQGEKGAPLHASETYFLLFRLILVHQSSLNQAVVTACRDWQEFKILQSKAQLSTSFFLTSLCSHNRSRSGTDGQPTDRRRRRIHSDENGGEDGEAPKAPPKRARPTVCVVDCVCVCVCV